MKSSPAFLRKGDYLSLIALWNVALAPLLNLLARNAQFFVYRQLNQVDLILFVVILCFVVPAFIGFVTFSLWKLNRRIGLLYAGVMLCVLLLLIVIPGFNRHQLASQTFVIPVLSICTLGVTVGYFRMQALRSFFMFLWSAILIVPVYFFLEPPIRKLLDSNEHRIPIIETEVKIPIVLIVFDELPTASLIDANEQIIPDCYPVFNMLSQKAIWFRNATTVSDRTEEAIPAILTGKLPRPGTLPVTLDHPRNLINLLSSSYELKTSESLSRFSPDGSAIHRKEKSIERIRLALRDTAWILVSMIVPPEYARSLDSIGTRWGDFGDSRQPGIEAHRGHPVEMFQEFTRAVENTGRPTFYFLHSFFPHMPWRFLPDGRTFIFHGDIGRMPRSENWRNQDSAVALSYYRHLLQTRYADALLGELIEKLKSENLYDQCLLIVTSDHGMGFTPGEFSRAAKASNIGDIAYVPLFVKLPGMQRGEIRDDPVQLIDLFPTIAELLQFPVPWKLDGQSFLNRTVERQKIQVYASKEKTLHNFPVSTAAKTKAVQWRIKNEMSCSASFSFGPENLKTFVGKPVPSDLQMSDIKLRINAPWRSNSEIQGSSSLPLYVLGTVDSKRQLNFAVALNGKVQAVTQSFQLNEKVQAFEVLLPEESLLQDGPDQLQILLLSKDGSMSEVYRSKNTR